MNIYLMVILLALIGEYVLQGIVDYLNLKALNTDLPSEFLGFYEADRYRRSQEYTITHTKFNYVVSTFYLLLAVLFILFGGFNWVDRFVRGFDMPPVITGLFFLGLLYFAYDIISIPFSLYRTFIIEEKFGFNKMNPKTFLLDMVKSYLLIILLGSPLMGGVLYFFESAGPHAWLYAWIFIGFVIIIAQPLYTLVIAPLFNTFSPLEEGSLKEDIEQYCKKVKFPLKEVCIMDGSKRSSHSNAYFSGIFKKRITLFDTLLKQHSPDELVAIVAHEVGHYKKRHIIKGMIISIVHTGILLYLLSFFIKSRGLFDAFGMEHLSVYAGLVFFGMLYSPIQLLLSVLLNHISRKHEFEADFFAAETTGAANAMILALKNLSVANLGNLTPHPLHVVLNYSHPPVLERIVVLRSLGSEKG